MVIELFRKEVIKAIQLHNLLHLSLEEKGAILLNEGIEDVGDEDEGWNEEKISKHEYNELITEQFNFSDLVTNEYLELTMRELYKVEIKIIDDQPSIENAVRCICCNYKIAFDIETFDICPVCLWQHVYIKSEESYSAPNHSSLKDYRENFWKKYLQDPNNIIYKMLSK